LLRVTNLEVSYDDVKVVHGLSFRVGENSIVSLLGPNGAGKTTTLRAISGVLGGVKGRVEFLGEDITKKDPNQIVEMGLVQVPEGRQLFPDMTVLENLKLGAYNKRAKQKRADTLEYVFELFPRLKERMHQKAGTLSGGEQQMVAIGRGLMALPKLLALDEPSLGLAPVVVRQMFDTIDQIRQRGISILLVEQNLMKSLELSNYGYVLEMGQIKMEGTNTELLNNPATRKAYLGLE